MIYAPIMTLAGAFAIVPDGERSYSFVQVNHPAMPGAARPWSPVSANDRWSRPIAP